jgi:uncharacterized membrane protein YgaE (UPF0421/DUF939 family)
VFKTHYEIQAQRERRLKAGTDLISAIAVGLIFSIPFIVEIIKELSK